MDLPRAEGKCHILVAASPCHSVWTPPGAAQALTLRSVWDYLRGQHLLVFCSEFSECDQTCFQKASLSLAESSSSAAIPTS